MPKSLILLIVSYLMFMWSEIMFKWSFFYAHQKSAEHTPYRILTEVLET